MRCLLFIFVLLLTLNGNTQEGGELIITPPVVHLKGHRSTQQVIVTTQGNGLVVDLTREAQFQSADPSLLESKKGGLLSALGSGKTELIIRHREKEVRIPVEIHQGEKHLPVTFEQDIQPILTRMGCNAGTCHGKQRGQNGFQLSLLGFDHDFDFDALVREGRGRRVFPAAPPAASCSGRQPPSLPMEVAEESSRGANTTRPSNAGSQQGFHAPRQKPLNSRR